MYGERKGWDLGGVGVVAAARAAERGACGPFEVPLRFLPELLQEQVRRLRVIPSKCPVHRTLASGGACVIERRIERV